MKINKSNLKEKDGYYYEFKDTYDKLPDQLEVPAYTEHILTETMTNKEIMEKWEKKPFTTEQAFAVASDIAPKLKNGEFRIVYFRDDEVPCRLVVWRSGGGQLDLNMNEVYLGLRWSSGSGVLVSNENSDLLPDDSLELKSFDARLKLVEDALKKHNFL